jgi:2-furoate---CoA ligase
MQTCADILRAAAARAADAMALVEGERTLSYGELLAEAERLAAGLFDLGLAPGDRLASLLPNRTEAALLHWAAQLSGLVITPCNWRSTAADLDHVLADSGAVALVFDERSADAVAGSTAARAIPRIGLDAAPGADLGFPDVPALRDTDLPAPVADATSVLLYTSGTTGAAKGVPRSHRAERAAALAHVAQNAILAGERTLGVMPLYHTIGVRLLLAMALVNGTFVCQRRFDPREALTLVARHRLTSLYLVPTLYHDLLAHPDFPATDVSSVRALGFAGAAMTDGLLRRLDAAFSPRLFVNHYGSSEVYTFTVLQDAPRKPGSAGRAGINAEIRVVRLGSRDPADRADPCEDGEIIARLASDEAFAGYWKRPDSDLKVLVDGWYFTGDVGHFDAEGDLFVIGRVDDMMITGGENVLPAEVESVLSLHPSVAEVAVAGRPDERLGHRVTAFVVRSSEVAPADLDLWCRQSELADFKRPRTYVFVDEIPKSPVGKILRRLLAS